MCDAGEAEIAKGHVYELKIVHSVCRPKVEGECSLSELSNVVRH